VREKVKGGEKRKRSRWAAPFLNQRVKVGMGWEMAPRSGNVEGGGGSDDRHPTTVGAERGRQRPGCDEIGR
jgi:hypothetical protein